MDYLRNHDIYFSVLLVLAIIQVAILVLICMGRRPEKKKPDVYADDCEPESLRKHSVRYKIKTADSSLLQEGSELYFVADKVLKVFEQQKPYLNPELKISDLTALVGTNRNYLSKAINSFFMKNFCQLCNYYRVREACSLFLKNPGLGKAEWIKRSGFISFSSFSSCFTNYTGYSPTRWRKEIFLRLERKETIDADEYIRDFRKTVNF